MIWLFYLQKPVELGDIMFSLSYLPTAERLTVVVVKMRNLKWGYGKDAGGMHSVQYYSSADACVYKHMGF